MSKGVKYIAPSGNSGYAEAAKDYMIALHNAGVSVTFEPFRFDSTDKRATGKRNELVNSFIGKDVDYDTVIIHSTPEHWGGKMSQNQGKKIIGMTVWETTRLHPEWVAYINRVHDVVVPCEWNRDVLRESGIVRPITVVPHIMKEQAIVPGRIDGIEDRYVFYTIGQWHNRKGIDDTIRAYLMAFTSNDKVALVVKTFSDDFSESQKQRTLKRVEKVVSEFSDPARIVLILDEMVQKQMEAIHTIGDCYVSLCKSEGWGLGAFDAAGRGKPVIMTGFGGQMDFLKKGSHRIVGYNLVNVDGMPWIKWYLPEQKWAKPNLDHGADMMRQVFDRKCMPSQPQADWMNETFGEQEVVKDLKNLLI